MLLQPAGAEEPQGGCDWVVIHKNQPPCLESDHPLTSLVKDGRDSVPSLVLAPNEVRSLNTLAPIQLASKMHDLAAGTSHV